MISIKTGQLISERYEILEKLGEGGFGAVFHALDKVMGREVALKVLKLGFDASEKNVSHFKLFKREAKLLAQLTHRNIMAVYSFEWLDKISPIIVMEYLKGRNLQDLLNEAGCGLSYHQCRTIFSQLCSGLSYAHEQGVIHRDLSPANIFLIDDTELTVKIIDFGLAKLLESETSKGATRTLTGTVVGNPAYMSPEQCRGEQLDACSDIYSFGCILFEALSGKKPFDANNSIGLMLQHQTDYPAAPEFNWGNELIESRYKNIALKCLQKDKSKRFHSTDEISKLLLDDQSFGNETQLFNTMKPWSSDAAKRHPRSVSRQFLIVSSSILLLCICILIISNQYKTPMNSERAIDSKSGVRVTLHRACEIVKVINSNRKSSKGQLQHQLDTAIAAPKLTPAAKCYLIFQRSYLDSDWEPRIRRLAQAFELAELENSRLPNIPNGALLLACGEAYVRMLINTGDYRTSGKICDQLILLKQTVPSGYGDVELAEPHIYDLRLLKASSDFGSGDTKSASRQLDEVLKLRVWSIYRAPALAGLLLSLNRKEDLRNYILGPTDLVKSQILLFVANECCRHSAFDIAELCFDKAKPFLQEDSSQAYLKNVLCNSELLKIQHDKGRESDSKVNSELKRLSADICNSPKDSNGFAKLDADTFCLLVILLLKQGLDEDAHKVIVASKDSIWQVPFSVDRRKIVVELKTYSKDPAIQELISGLQIP